ncbi:hypothetical protein GWI33_017264 [Rhynchophorus ferrugineus]|uniref:Uncharacterized protein n=1 Tax=Rhynchophorus ferrugineus TaxID=354439 RepID=A0A834M6E4_RHYFE|nr:hypothetical protein GWI33_017264 [Rhynchophorus ferrugineus]
MRNLFDRRGTFLIFFLWALNHIFPGLSLYCDKAFTYYEEYGQNSFNVTCKDITKETEHVLENININNEISLTVLNSTLESVTPSLFRNVRNIKILNIIDSHFTYDIRLAIFNKLGKLESLTIKNTTFLLANFTLYGLDNLKHFQFSYDNLSSISKHSLKHLNNLERLELYNNQIKNLRDVPLCGLRKLKILDLSQNVLTDLDEFFFQCDGEQEQIKLQLNDSVSRPNIYRTSFYNISGHSVDISELDLSQNSIRTLGESLEKLEKLRFLDLSFNELTKVNNLHFATLSRLEKLVLKHNQLQHFQASIFENKTQLRVVDVSYNDLNEITVFNVPRLQYLNVGYNSLVTVILRNLPNLREVHLNDNNFAEISPDDFESLPNLFTINLSGNKLFIIDRLFRNIPTVRYLDLSRNAISNLSGNTFNNLTDLRTLDLANNALTSLNGDPFLSLEYLEVLNLSSNALESLSYFSLEPLQSLRTLDVSSNKLKFIEYDVILSRLPGLNNINIKYNLLTCENLSKLIVFLRKRHIGYTHTEYLDLENINQNIAGIPCRSVNKNLIVEVNSVGGGSAALFTFGVTMIIILVSVVTGITSYKFYVYLKRRNYRADEFELVDE